MLQTEAPIVLSAHLSALGGEVVDASPDPVVVMSCAGTVLYANPAAEAFFECGSGALVGTSLDVPVPPRNRPCVEVIDASGQIRVAELRSRETEWMGQPVYVLALRDVTDRERRARELRDANARLHRANRRIQALAEIDPLTSLLNRRGLERVLLQELSRSSRGGGALVAVLVDCDDFKGINDSMGHAVGDVILTEIAGKLRRCVRPADTVARIGGDEFLLLLPDTRVAEGLAVAERVRLAIGDAPLRVREQPLEVTASLGVATVPRELLSLEDLLSATHLALRRSKSCGKNQVTAADRSDPANPRDPTGRDDASVIDLSRALAGGRCLRTVAQPIPSARRSNAGAASQSRRLAPDASGLSSTNSP